MQTAASANHAAGQKVFKLYCETCHGAGGQGDGVAAGALNQKPANFAAGAFRYDVNGNGTKGDIDDIKAIGQAWRVAPDGAVDDAHAGSAAGRGRIREGFPRWLMRRRPGVLHACSRRVVVDSIAPGRRRQPTERSDARGLLPLRPTALRRRTGGQPDPRHRTRRLQSRPRRGRRQRIARR